MVRRVEYRPSLQPPPLPSMILAVVPPKSLPLRKFTHMIERLVSRSQRSLNLRVSAYWVPIVACIFITNAIAQPPTPKRIAALAPSITELVYVAGAGDKLVAASAYSDYPAAAKSLPQVADFAGVNIEALLVTKPDLVLVWTSGTREADIARLQSLRIQTEAIGVSALADVPKAMRKIGELAGTSKAAEAVARQFETRLVALKKTNATKPRVSVFFNIGDTKLLSINNTHFIAETMRVCGGDNIFGDIKTLVFEVSPEELARRQPQVIFESTSDKTKVVNAKNYPALNAARHGQMYAITANYILRPGPRLIEGAEEICRALDRARTTLVRQLR